MKISLTSLATLLATGLIATACGDTKFSQKSGAIRDGLGALTGDESQGGSGDTSEIKQSAEAQGAGGEATPADTIKAELTTTAPTEGGAAEAPIASEAVPGWSLTCNSSLFAGVFASTEDSAEAFSLLGWGSKGGGGNEGTADLFGDDEKVNGAFALLDECLELDLKAEREQGLEYVLVKFDSESFKVTEVNAYDPAVIPGVNKADYNSCAVLAGAPKANRSVDAIAELVSSSQLAGHASCGDSGCCINIK